MQEHIPLQHEFLFCSVQAWLELKLLDNPCLQSNNFYAVAEPRYRTDVCLLCEDSYAFAEPTLIFGLLFLSVLILKH